MTLIISKKGNVSKRRRRKIMAIRKAEKALQVAVNKAKKELKAVGVAARKAERERKAKVLELKAKGELVPVDLLHPILDP